MNKFILVVLPVLLGLGTSARAESPVLPGVRVVPCDKPVKSAKRGVCLNQMSAADFMALSPSVSWWYNWHYTDTQNPPKAANMEFLPMAWGARPEDLAGLKTYLATHKPSRVLTLNEPNLKGQAFISPAQSADFYKKVNAITDASKIPLVGPHMALGSSAGDSITALDPIEQKEVTYTFMVPYLKAFLHDMGDINVSAVAAHSYGNSGELNWMTGMLHKEFKRPVWVTEFAQWDAPTPEAERDYMIQSVDLFERSPFVEGYAWFKERVESNTKISLLDKESGKLTMLGQAYVQMPVHDPNVFYALPGRLQSESYLRMEKPSIGMTSDGEGFLDVAPDANSSLDYNLAVQKAGKYSLRIRCKAVPGTRIEVFSEEIVMASATTQSDGWQTVETSIPLPKANVTLGVRASASVHLNWMEFSIS